MRLIGLLALFVIFGFIGFIIYQSDQGNIDPVKSFGADVSRLQEITRTIKCYTETKDFTCGSLTYNANNEAILEETKVIEITEEQTIITENGG